MLIKGIISEDFVNYKKVCMTIEFPYCNWKCGKEYCQNTPLAKSPNLDISKEQIINLYLTNPITCSICFQGLEPFDSWQDLKEMVQLFRQKTKDDIIIYTGYIEKEIFSQVQELKQYPNIIIKFGRFIPNQEKHYDNILGVYLASPNQYAEQIS